MKSKNIYEIKLLDGTYYKGEISHMDDEVVILKLGTSRLSKTLRVFHDMIVSIRQTASSQSVGECVCFQD
jgi:hypothetical protein